MFELQTSFELVIFELVMSFLYQDVHTYQINKQGKKTVSVHVILYCIVIVMVTSL